MKTKTVKIIGGRDLPVGKLGEKIAGEFLKREGYKIREFNYQNEKGKRLGEVDIIVQKKAELTGRQKIVFVEVKSRMVVNLQRKDVLPEENITRRKLFKLRKIADLYIKKNKLFHYDYGFDAVTVLIDGIKRRAKIKHLKDIFF